MSTTVQFLKQVRQLIATPKAWCQCHLALTRFGIRTAINDPNAETWCLVGAMVKVNDPNPSDACYIKASQMLQQLTPNNCGLSVYNDSHSHTEVIALLDKAIKANTGWRKLLTAIKGWFKRG